MAVPILDALPEECISTLQSKIIFNTAGSFVSKHDFNIKDLPWIESGVFTELLCQQGMGNSTFKQKGKISEVERWSFPKKQLELGKNNQQGKFTLDMH